ncbi:MAG: hypothetical protein ABSG45_04565 [Nitrososphaerales archaeon]
MKEPKLGVEIRRDVEIKLLPFTDYFVGFEKIPAVESLFGAKTAKVLKDLRVEFFSLRFGYMSVSDEDGHLLISTNHLKNAELKVIYLDVIHELFHVKQFMEGKNLFQNEFEYVDSPIEVPAYKFTIEEAKRIGMKTNEIIEYLKVEWVTEEQHARLVKTLALS